MWHDERKVPVRHRQLNNSNRVVCLVKSNGKLLMVFTSQGRFIDNCSSSFENSSVCEEWQNILIGYTLNILKLSLHLYITEAFCVFDTEITQINSRRCQGTWLLMSRWGLWRVFRRNYEAGHCGSSERDWICWKICNIELWFIFYIF
jgi:hypothetical protein